MVGEDRYEQLLAKVVVYSTVAQAAILVALATQEPIERRRILGQLRAGGTMEIGSDSPEQVERIRQAVERELGSAIDGIGLVVSKSLAGGLG